MGKKSDEGRSLFNNLKEEVSNNILPPSIAKLYSQYHRLNMKQPGLKGWNDEIEFSSRLSDAVSLIDAGLLEKEYDSKEWRELLKRGAEILEWLSQPTLNSDKLPLRLLSAATYQLAGYPALALGILNTESIENTESLMLKALLKGDFQELITQTVKYWELEISDEHLTNDYAKEIQKWIVNETVKTFGVIGAYMRWGDKERLEKAMEKFTAISKVVMDGKDSYSWMLSKLCAEVILEYKKTSLRSHVEQLAMQGGEEGEEAFQKYLKNSFLEGKSQAWYSQVKGIERLKQGNSFALCTPTGSGKTTIAELAIIQSLFSHEKQDFITTGTNNRFFEKAPIVMYIVPSRALAAEVEYKLAKVLSNLSTSNIKVTGLYGGIDWGPTDAWITSDEPTVLVCTYEKGEALLRFLGPLFLERVSLVVIDEAHSVQFDGNFDTLINSDNRGLRLEMLANRLIYSLENRKVIALSAVADGGIQELSNWVAGSMDSEPEVTDYRSTRQLIGRLEWKDSGNFKMKYDLLNGSSLKFGEVKGESDVPFIQTPFSPFPNLKKGMPKKYSNAKVGKRQRPYLFWSAIQSVKPDELGKQQSVLISITQHISGYAEDFVYFFEKLMSGIEVPEFFFPPIEADKVELWEKCLRSCEDYFGADSNEYKLLQRGIAVHHGNMPGLMSRLLTQVISRGIVRLTLATSTLSEGVNLPFETIIIPTVIRGQDRLKLSEFKNLAGRAGRPGTGTEGKTLVMIDGDYSDYSSENALQKYKELINEMTNFIKQNKEEKSRSPIGELIKYLIGNWMKLTNSNSTKEFLEWIEQVSPIDSDVHKTHNQEDLIKSIDSLDGILITDIVEYEQMILKDDTSIDRSQLEEHLKETWKRTYANFNNRDLKILERVFSLRGGAIVERIYPLKSLRRNFYKTSLSPRYANELLNEYQNIRSALITGLAYASWTDEEKVDYIYFVVENVTALAKFEIPLTVGKFTSKDILHWWLSPKNSEKKPDIKQISKWIKYIKKNFEYIFNWGLGSIVSLSIDETSDSILQETSIEDWPDTGLPWIVFWLKELIVWGTTDPVVAFLLSQGIEHTRDNAEIRAQNYYNNFSSNELIDEIYNASSIRKWGEGLKAKNRSAEKQIFLNDTSVHLTRNFEKVLKNEWRVLPLLKNNIVSWIDPAGYELAISPIIEHWPEEALRKLDFTLNVEKSSIIVSNYI